MADRRAPGAWGCIQHLDASPYNADRQGDAPAKAVVVPPRSLCGCVGPRVTVQMVANQVMAGVPVQIVHVMRLGSGNDRRMEVFSSIESMSRLRQNTPITS